MTEPTTTRRGLPSLDELRAMQTLATRYPAQATHAVDLPYRLAWRRSDRPERAEAALWYASGDLIGWAVWSPSGRSLELAVHPAHARGAEPRGARLGGGAGAGAARGRGGARILVGVGPGRRLPARRPP